VVVPPAALRALWARRLLRPIAVAARHSPRHGRQAPGHPDLRADEDWFYDYRTDQYGEGPELAPPQHHPVDQPVRHGHRPRVRPIDELYVDGTIYVGGSPEAAWVRAR